MSFRDIADLIFVRAYVRHPIQNSAHLKSLKTTKPTGIWCKIQGNKEISNLLRRLQLPVG